MKLRTTFALRVSGFFYTSAKVMVSGASNHQIAFPQR